MVLCLSYSFAQLIKTTWGQGAPFNKFCPTYIDSVDNQAVSKASAVGCGAVALGQVLNYYHLPEHGYGEVSENDIIVHLDSIQLDYEHIREQYNDEYTIEEVDAVATLLHIAGLSMNMHYGESSAPRTRGSMMWSMQHHLHIDPSSRYLHRRNYTTKEWLQLINEHLEAKTPIIYRGTYYNNTNKAFGHIFVLDGKDDTGNYHINLGKTSNNQDKFVDLNIINQSNGAEVYPGGEKVCYNGQQAMIVNCIPQPGLNDSDYEFHPMVLEDPFVFNDNTNLDSVSISGEDSVKINFTLLDCSMEAGIVYYGLGIFQNDSLVNPREISFKASSYTFLNAGASRRTCLYFSLSKEILDGEYEVKLMYRHDTNQEWTECRSDALNRMALKVVDGQGELYSLQPSRRKALILTDDIREITESNQKGRTYEVKLAAPENAYYEGPLRFSFIINGKEYNHTYNIGVYEGCAMTYHIYIPYTKIPVSNGDARMTCSYQPEATYIELTKLTESGIESILEVDDSSDVFIFSLSGTYLQKCRKEVFVDEFNKLTRGAYVIRENNDVRKLIKY